MWVKVFKFVSLGILGLAFLFYGAMYMPTHLDLLTRQTHPGDRDFNPEDFRFDDFEKFTHKTKDGKIKIEDVLLQMFPLGTSKEYVDRILVDNAKAQAMENLNGGFGYQKNIGKLNLDAWVLNFQFDEKMKTKSMQLGKHTIY